MAKDPVDQNKLNQQFMEVCSALRYLYSAKNVKYANSFAKSHKNYKEAHYNIKRKFARLENLASKKKMNPMQEAELFDELVDMGVYTVMCIMKFCKKKFPNQDLMIRRFAEKY